ncbi:hypothetical protein JCGZ_19890 [Jatropha curcas]|uniref:Phytocyanin domain-containing protein n=1 Tax=Jatropha curcas TaxID=180498 RepID=A0A067JTA1_JATCU|nr:lamin-like protein [Jatropha curcas]KDP27191.1 hypothetical protein JCGZ_19890 [Jatropha curcas]
MESSVKKKIARLVIVVAVMMILKGADCELIKIGKSGWIPNYNYTEWLSQNPEQFHVGDWLYFVYDINSFNVLEVNETSYKSCNEQGFLRNYTRGGRDVVELKEARPYYFLSGGGYCWNGMKVAILVQQLPAVPGPAPSKNGSPLPTTAGSFILIMSIAFYLTLAI